MAKFSKTLAEVNKPEVRKLPLWTRNGHQFILHVAVPTLHNISHLRAAFKTDPADEKASQLDLHKKAIERRVRTSLVDWEGLTDDDGNLVPFSEEQAVELFCKTDDAFGVANLFLTFFAELQREVFDTNDWTTGIKLSEVETVTKK